MAETSSVSVSVEHEGTFMAGAFFGAVVGLVAAFGGVLLAHHLMGPLLVAESETRAATDAVEGARCWGRP